jgi:hypothetical protein
VTFDTSSTPREERRPTPEPAWERRTRQGGLRWWPTSSAQSQPLQTRKSRTPSGGVQRAPYCRSPHLPSSNASPPRWVSRRTL